MIKKLREVLGCQLCGKEFEVIIGNPKNQKWCSHKCAYEGIKKNKQATSVQMECPQCGIQYRVYESQAKNGRGKFCSRECFENYRKDLYEIAKLTRKCCVCEKVFKISPGALSGSRVWKYCSQGCYLKERANKARKRDGQKHINNGYVQIYMYDHPSVKGKRVKRIMEHRLVMEKHLGRVLENWEHVHHKNGIKDDNCIENLELWIQKGHPTGKRLDDIHSVDVERLIAKIATLEKENEKLKNQLAYFGQVA